MFSHFGYFVIHPAGHWLCYRALLGGQLAGRHYQFSDKMDPAAWSGRSADSQKAGAAPLFPFSAIWNEKRCTVAQSTLNTQETLLAGFFIRGPIWISAKWARYKIDFDKHESALLKGRFLWNRDCSSQLYMNRERAFYSSAFKGFNISFARLSWRSMGSGWKIQQMQLLSSVRSFTPLHTTLSKR